MITSTACYSTYLEARDNDEIEPSIKPLTDALYNLGVHPLASCGGHRGYFYPYVAFSGSQDDANTIHKAINKAYQSCSFYWDLTAHFQMDTPDLVWRLSPNTDRIGRRLWGLKKYRKDLACDIAEIVKSIT
ncbi:hypothetical protein [Vibrio sp. 10N.261.46.A3]|uniref:hypothetical protein n=1 Tax=Vibrio sp. 10N.261.46.A3 TaxID=3229658 RepID=UPI00354FAAE5